MNNKKKFFDNSIVGMYQTRIKDGSVIIANRKLVEIFRYVDFDEYFAKHNACSNYVDPQKRDELFKKLETHGRVDDFEIQLYRGDGTKFWACLSAEIFPDQGYLEGMILDIDKRKKAEDANKHLARRLLCAQEEERIRIARDLHDELGQDLSTLQFSLNKLKTSLPNVCDTQKRMIDNIASSIEKTGDKVRKISSDLRPSMLDHLGLIIALESYIFSFMEHNPLTRVDFQVMGYKKRLKAEVEIVLYRVTQEALNNIRRHAGASTVKIMLTLTYPQVILIIGDNGTGFSQNQNSGNNGGNAIGILGMKERIDSLGGMFTLHSALGKGTTIRAEIPVNGLNN